MFRWNTNILCQIQHSHGFGEENGNGSHPACVTTCECVHVVPTYKKNLTFFFFFFLSFIDSHMGGKKSVNEILS